MAVQANVPIVPVVIANYSHLYNAKEKRFLSGVVRAKSKINFHMMTPKNMC